MKELYKRIIIPLYIPILMLIPYILITSSKESSSFAKIRFATFLIGLFFIIFSETTIRLISEKLITNLSIVVIPIIVFFTFYFIFYNKFNYRNKTK